MTSIGFGRRGRGVVVAEVMDEQRLDDGDRAGIGDPANQRRIDEHRVLEPGPAGYAIQNVGGPFDGCQSDGDGFVSDRVLGDLKPPRSGCPHRGIERVLFPEEDPLVKETVRTAAEAGLPARGADRSEASTADRAAKRRRRGSHDLAPGGAQRATFTAVEEELRRPDRSNARSRARRLAIKARREHAGRANRHPMHGQRQPVLPGGSEVEPLERRRHGGVPDARDPTPHELSPVSFGLCQPCVVGSLEQRIARSRLGEEAGRLHDLAGESSTPVPHDHPAIRIGCLSTPPHGGEPRGVQARLVTRVRLQEQRAIRADLVQLLEPRRTPLSQLRRLIPTAADPSLRALRGDLADTRQERLHRRVRLMAHIRPASVERREAVVVVSVDEPRQHRGTAERQHPHVPAHGSTHVRRRAYGDDPALAHSHCLRARARPVHRDDIALQDELTLMLPDHAATLRASPSAGGARRCHSRGCCLVLWG